MSRKAVKSLQSSLCAWLAGLLEIGSLSNFCKPGTVPYMWRKSTKVIITLIISGMLSSTVGILCCFLFTSIHMLRNLYQFPMEEHGKEHIPLHGMGLLKLNVTSKYLG